MGFFGKRALMKRWLYLLKKNALSVLGQLRVSIESRKLADALLQKRQMNGDGYRDYLLAQIETSLLKSESAGLNKRTAYLTALMEPHVPFPRSGQTFLCVGCRNTFELDHIEQKCGIKTLGVDLFSRNPSRIQVQDMHKMSFSDDMFDGVYACHSLEHSHDLGAALSEFIRVLKPGGLLTIEVPVCFTPSKSDRQDVGSVDNLISRIGGNLDKVLFKEETEREVRGQRKREARIIVRIKK
jgi:SAM-dependent methyltransferase